MKELKKLSRANLTKIIKDFAKKQEDPKIAERILDALDYAIHIHFYQKPRPDGPYIHHVLRVAVLLILIGITNPDIIIAALLHDSVEDQKERILDGGAGDLRSSVTVESAFTILEYKFGSAATAFIRAVTNPDWSAISEKSERNKLYLAHVKELLAHDPEAGVIKLGDFYDNGISLSSITDIARRKALAEKYLPIFDVFINAVPKFMAGLVSDEQLTEIMDDLQSGHAYAQEVLVV